MTNYKHSCSHGNTIYHFSVMSINRSGETTVELATQSRKSFIFFVKLNFLCNIFFTGRVLLFVNKHNRNNYD